MCRPLPPSSSFAFFYRILFRYVYLLRFLPNESQCSLEESMTDKTADGTWNVPATQHNAT